MLHLNGGLICSIDCETSGLKAGHHDLLEVAILPLDKELRPRQDIMPFDIKLQPKFPDRADPRAMRVNRLKISELLIDGIDVFQAIDFFETWFGKLRLREGKKIMPLAQNWPFDREFLIAWLGAETFNHYFDYHYRDTCVVANYCNDIADLRNEKYPFAKQNLQYLCTQLNVKTERSHRALEDALATAEVYRRMLQMA